jgi:hydrogenase maturation protein HypF
LGLLLAAGPQALGHPGAAHTRAAFTSAETELLLAMIQAGVNCPWSSSLGRLFDAVASLLGVCQRLSYEGEAGLRLQGLAALEHSSAAVAPPGPGAYPLPLRRATGRSGGGLPLGWLDWQPLLEALLLDLAAGRSRGCCAVRFHMALVAGLGSLLERAAAASSCRQVVLAGGCFQNALLLEGLIADLRQRQLVPYWAQAIPGNDGGLALGQVWASQFQGPGRLRR